MYVSKVSSAIQSGLSGILSAEQGVEEASVNIGRLNIQAEQNQISEDIESDSERAQRPVSLEAEAVNLVVSEHLARANVQVIKTADDMLGSLIDTKV